jgi:hypothetical protein
MRITTVLSLTLAMLLLACSTARAIKKSADTTTDVPVLPASASGTYVLPPAPMDIAPPPSTTETVQPTDTTETLPPPATEIEVPPPAKTEIAPPPVKKTAVPPPAEEVTGTDTLEIIENATETMLTGDIVSVSGARVYVNRGSSQGIMKGQRMAILSVEEVRDLNDRVIGREQQEIGELEVMEVRPAFCITRVITSTVEPARGMHVRYAAPQTVVETMKPVMKGECPRGMMFVPGGEFSYFSDTKQEAGKETEAQVAFCVDMKVQASTEWPEADATCASAGKRLCTKREYRKVCSMTKTIKDGCATKTGCLPKKFGGMLEWTAALPDEETTGDEDTTPLEEVTASSCKCLSTNPACVGCYTPGCPGIKQQFRCCAPAVITPDTPLTQ